MLDAKVVVLLEHLRKFWRSVDFQLSNCEIELDLSWSKVCLIPEIAKTSGIAGNPTTNSPFLAVTAIESNGPNFQINNNKLYVPVTVLPINFNIKFLEHSKQPFKRTIYCNKYKLEITKQPFRLSDWSNTQKY